MGWAHCAGGNKDFAPLGLAVNMRTVKYGFLAVLGGVCSFLSAPPICLWPLLFPAVACFAAVTFFGSVRLAFASAFFWGLVYFGLLFDWVTVSSGSVLARIVLSVAEALFVAVLGVLWNGLARFFPSARKTFAQTLFLSVFCAVLWVGIEEIRSRFPFGGMPWGLAAFSLNDSPLLRLAPYGSVHLVGFTAVAAAVLGFWAVVHIFAGKRFLAVGSGLLAAALVLLPSAFPRHFSGRGLSPIRVGIVQGNVPTKEELAQGVGREITVSENHVRRALSLIRSEKVDLLLLPESASDLDFRTDPQAGALFRGLAKKANVPVLLGTQHYIKNLRTNDYVLLTPEGKIGDTYSKQHPVPFGEYLPFRSLITRIVPRAREISSDMIPGRGPAVVKVNLRGKMLKIAVPICFEVAYTSVVAQAMQDAGFLVVPTNNASFGNTGEADQQFAMTRFRAAEHGVSAVQVSTSGISGAVDPQGRVLYRSALFTADSAAVKVYPAKGHTFATRTYFSRLIAVAAANMCAAACSLSGFAAGKIRARRPRR